MQKGYVEVRMNKAMSRAIGGISHPFVMRRAVVSSVEHADDQLAFTPPPYFTLFK